MIESIEHKSGLKVIVNKLNERKLIAVKLFTKVGAAYEPLKLKGISHFLEDVLFVRSSHYPEPDSVALEYGVDLNGRTSEEWTCIGFICQRNDFSALIDLLLDLSLNATFIEGDIERIKPRIAAGASERLTVAPWNLSEINLSNLIFGEKKMDISGDAEKILQFNYKDVKNWYKRFYHPNNTFLMVSGDVTLENVITCIDKHPFEYKEKTEIKTEEWILRTIPKGNFIYEQKRDIETEIMLGFISSVDYLPFLEIISVLLGNYPGSLLWQIGDGKCYMTESTIQVYSSLAILNIYLGVISGKEKEVLQILLESISNIGKNTFIGKNILETSMINRAKKICTRELMRNEEDLEKSLYWLANRNLYKNRSIGFDSFYKSIDEMSISEIGKAAKILFEPTNTFVSMVGNVTDELIHTLSDYGIRESSKNA